MESQTDRQAEDSRTNKWTNGTDKNYIPLQHILYARGIINLPKEVLTRQ